MTVRTLLLRLTDAARPERADLVVRLRASLGPDAEVMTPSDPESARMWDLQVQWAFADAAADPRAHPVWDVATALVADRAVVVKTWCFVTAP